MPLPEPDPLARERENTLYSSYPQIKLCIFEVVRVRLVQELVGPASPLSQNASQIVIPYKPVIPFRTLIFLFIAVKGRDECVRQGIPCILTQDMRGRVHKRFREQEGISCIARCLNCLTGLAHFREIAADLVRLVHGQGPTVSRPYIGQVSEEIQVREMVHPRVVPVLVHSPLGIADDTVPALPMAHVFLVFFNLFRVASEFGGSLDKCKGILKCGGDPSYLSVRIQDTWVFDELYKNFVSQD